MNNYMNQAVSVEIVRLSENAVIPSKAHGSDAGLDLYANDDFFIKVGETGVVTTGISMGIPSGYFGKIEDRSGLAMLGLKTGGGVVDSGYTGEIKIVIHNINNSDSSNYRGRGYQIKKGQRVAQLVIQPTPAIRLLELEYPAKTERGTNGFGSSGL